MKSSLFTGRNIFIGLAVAVAAFILFGRPSLRSVAAPYEGEPEVIAASFTSAWCSACKILEPRLASVIPDFRQKPVKFVELDFTFGQQKDIRAAAKADGFEAVYDRFKGATGFTLLIDRDTGDIIDTLTISYSEKAMRAAIANALAVAEKTGPDAPSGS